MWQPPESWRGLAGHGPASRGVWLVPGTVLGVAKRLDRPGPDAEPQVWLPGHSSYWCREALVASSGVVMGLSGLRSPEVWDVVEDSAGITIFSAHTAREPVSAVAVSEALGVLNAHPPPDDAWSCRRLQDERLAARQRRAAWPHLARTAWADLADIVWRRQAHLVGSLEAMPTGLAHGDLTPSNVMSSDGSSVVAVDWATAGEAALGEDLGYFWLSLSRQPLDPLVDAYVNGLLSTDRPIDMARTLLRRDVLRSARIVSVITGFARADWALSRVVGGEGPLFGKLNHPSVSRHLRALDRLRPHAEALVDLR